MERIFHVLQVDDDRKVDFGTYHLQKDAERWWATTWEIKFGNQPIEWEQFVEAFYAVYFPAHERSRKKQEFLDLQQRSSSLAEYVTRFRSLERYCPNLYTTEKERALKFAQGLKSVLRTKVYTRAPTTVDENLETASLLEHDWTESQKAPASRGQQQQHQGQKSWPRKRQFQRNQGGKKFHLKFH